MLGQASYSFPQSYLCSSTGLKMEETRYGQWNQSSQVKKKKRKEWTSAVHASNVGYCSQVSHVDFYDQAPA